MDAFASPQRDARFSELIVPEIDVLYRVALSTTRRSADAEDLVQDTLLRAYRSLDGFDGRYPRAWLLTIMRNAQINRVRRKRPELLRDPDQALAALADTDTDGATAETEIVDNMFESAVEQAFRVLPEKFKQVVELVDLEQLSYKEAADMLEVPVGTVMSRLHRARRRIRKQLEADGIMSARMGRDQ